MISLLYDILIGVVEFGLIVYTVCLVVAVLRGLWVKIRGK